MFLSIIDELIPQITKKISHLYENSKPAVELLHKSKYCMLMSNLVMY